MPASFHCGRPDVEPGAWVHLRSGGDAALQWETSSAKQVAMSRRSDGLSTAGGQVCVSAGPKYD